MARGSRDEKLGAGGRCSAATILPRWRLPLALAALACFAWGNAFAVGPSRAGLPVPGTAGCAPQVWRDATDQPWFYDEAGNLVVPQLNYAWLVVHFYPDPAAGDDATAQVPPAIRSVSALLEGQIADVIYDPGLDRDMCMFRLRSPDNSGVIAGSVARQSAVRAVRPAFTIDGEDFALLNAIDIRWKTQASEPDKADLLKKAGVSPLTADAGRQQRVLIDPCRGSVWATADLLHEDLHVVSASPAFVKVEPPVRATFAVGLNGTTIGAALPFTLEIRFAERIRLEPATIANLNLCPADLSRNLCRVEYDQPLSAVEVNASPIRLNGRLYLYGIGEFTVPEVPVYYRQSTDADAELAVARTPPVPVRIASVIPRAPGRYQLKVAEVQPLPQIAGSDSGPRKLAGIAVLAGGAGVFLACLLVLWRMTGAATASAPAPGVADVIDQHAGALRGFLEIPGDALGSADIGAFAHVFRAYLGARYGVPAESMGGGAGVFYATLYQRLPAELRPSVHDVLDLLETGLSRGELDAEEIARLFARSRDVLNHDESRMSG